MSEINDGGPAFPVADPFHMQPGTVTEAARLAGGMSLRDYFAAKAMQGLIGVTFSSAAAGDVDPKKASANLVAAAYAVADEMLKARNA